MDKLSVLREAHRLGGQARSDRMNKVAVFARQNQCVVASTGGRGGTMQVRYGSLNLPVLDMTVEGVVTIFIRPSTNAEVATELTRVLTEALAEVEDLRVTIAPRRASGKLTDLLEDVPEDALTEWVTRSVNAIRENIYENPNI